MTLSTRSVNTKSLQMWASNPRRGNLDTIRESLQTNGQYRPIVVNTGTHTKAKNQILCGNHTYLAARELGWDKISATFIDVDEQTARRIVAVDNRANDLASYDDQQLIELLQSIDDLEGTGFDAEDLLALIGDEDIDLEEDAPSAHLDELTPRCCQNCGYDTANNPEGLADWEGKPTPAAKNHG